RSGRLFRRPLLVGRLAFSRLRRRRPPRRLCSSQTTLEGLHGSLDVELALPALEDPLGTADWSNRRCRAPLACREIAPGNPARGAPLGEFPPQSPTRAVRRLRRTAAARLHRRRSPRRAAHFACPRAGLLAALSSQRRSGLLESVAGSSTR